MVIDWTQDEEKRRVRKIPFKLSRKASQSFSSQGFFGLTAGGFIPAGLYCITTWYKQSETSFRFALFFMGNSFSQAANGLVSYGILHMGGIAGFAGWQWLFIIDGLVSILVGVTFMALFPGRPNENVSLFGLGFFTDGEETILH